MVRFGKQYGDVLQLVGGALTFVDGVVQGPDELRGDVWVGEEEAQGLIRHSVRARCLLPAPFLLYVSQFLLLHYLIWRLLAALLQHLAHSGYFRVDLVAGLLAKDALEVGHHVCFPIVTENEFVPPLHLLWLLHALSVGLPIPFGCFDGLLVVPALLLSFMGCLYQLPVLSLLVARDLPRDQSVSVLSELVAFLETLLGVCFCHLQC